MLANACRWVQARLPLLAGDDLIGPDRRRVERHLIACAECRGRLKALRDALGALHAAADLPLAADPLWPALEREIRESRRRPSVPWVRRLAVPVAATLVVAAGLLWSARLDQRARRGASRIPIPPRVTVPPSRRPVVHRPPPDDEDAKPIALDAPVPRRRATITPAEPRVPPPLIH